MPKSPPSKENLLALIAEASHQERNAELELRRLVGQARELGVWWEQIGTALGVTKQGAQQRFGRNPVMNQLEANDDRLGTGLRPNEEGPRPKASNLRPFISNSTLGTIRIPKRKDR